MAPSGIGPHPLGERVPVHDGHPKIDQHQSGGFGLETGQRFLPIRGDHDPGTEGHQQEARDVATVRVIHR